jgi:hypothetical protein
MQGDVGHIADYPTVVPGWARRDVEEGARAEFVYGAVFHGGSGRAGEDQTNVLDVAARGTYGGAYVEGPLPAGLVGGTADGQAPDADDFENAFFEGADFIRGFETFEDGVEHERRKKWSRRRESNPHGAKLRQILSLLRLPVPPLRACLQT